MLIPMAKLLGQSWTLPSRRDAARRPPAARPRAVILVSALMVWFAAAGEAQVRLTDASDRAALRAWFVLLADAQFYRPTADVIDCAALVRHALREAFRPHTPEWLRQAALPVTQVHPDVRVKPPIIGGGRGSGAAGAHTGARGGSGGGRESEGGALGIFRVSADEPPAYGEFADARTIITLNAHPLGRDLAALRPGDLIYFHQPSQRAPDHLMVFIGRSAFERDGDDWLVYHTGDDPGEVRKVRLADLLKHPAPRWRPIAANRNFVGLFRLSLL